MNTDTLTAVEIRRLISFYGDRIKDFETIQIWPFRATSTLSDLADWLARLTQLRNALIYLETPISNDTAQTEVKFTDPPTNS